MLTRIAIAAVVALSVGTASAQNVIPATGPHSWLSVGETRATLDFYSHPSCDPECPDVWLICNNSGGMDIRVFNFSRRDIVDWMNAEGQFAGVRAEMFFLFNIEGTVTSFVVWNLALSDYSGAWVAESFIFGNALAEWLQIFGGSEEAVIETPQRTITLASRPEDLANRAAFANACLGLM